MAKDQTNEEFGAIVPACRLNLNLDPVTQILQSLRDVLEEMRIVNHLINRPAETDAVRGADLAEAGNRLERIRAEMGAEGSVTKSMSRISIQKDEKSG